MPRSRTQCMKNFRNGKSAGCDDIPSEAIKAGIEVSEEVLLDLRNQIWSREWRKDLLIKLPKKGDSSYCKSWRGIMLLNMASKPFCRMIAVQLIKTAVDGKLRDEPADFRAGRNFTEQTTTLRIIVDQNIEWQSSLYMKDL